jgi:uncharacterized protein DUF397
MTKTHRTWRKSTYSSGPNGMCVEVSSGVPDTLVRDSKRPAGPVLHFPFRDWRAFVNAVNRAALPHDGR